METSVHCPAVGAGSCDSWIGPAAAAAAVVAAAVAVDAADEATVAALLLTAAAEFAAFVLSAGLEHPASMTTPSAAPTTKARMPLSPCSTCCDDVARLP